MKTAAASIVCDNRNAAFWTVPKLRVDLNVLISCAVVFPFAYPIFQHLSDLSVCYGHFFDAVDLQSTRVKHLLYSTRC